jgi:hypothetical protein
MTLKMYLIISTLCALSLAVGCTSKDDTTEQATDAAQSDSREDTADTANSTDSSDPTSADAQDVQDTQDTPVLTEPFACGAPQTCTPSQACVGQWPGVCGGNAPGPNGCDSGCQTTNCGGGTYCICQSFSCYDLPTDCTGCDCATDSLPGAMSSACTCTQDPDGALRLTCMGA